MQHSSSEEWSSPLLRHFDDIDSAEDDDWMVSTPQMSGRHPMYERFPTYHQHVMQPQQRQASRGHRFSNPQLRYRVRAPQRNRSWSTRDYYTANLDADRLPAYMGRQNLYYRVWPTCPRCNRYPCRCRGGVRHWLPANPWDDNSSRISPISAADHFVTIPGQMRGGVVIPSDITTQLALPSYVSGITGPSRSPMDAGLVPQRGVLHRRSTAATTQGFSPTVMPVDLISIPSLLPSFRGGLPTNWSSSTETPPRERAQSIPQPRRRPSGGRRRDRHVYWRDDESMGGSMGATIEGGFRFRPLLTRPGDETLPGLGPAGPQPRMVNGLLIAAPPLTAGGLLQHMPTIEASRPYLLGPEPEPLPPPPPSPEQRSTSPFTPDFSDMPDLDQARGRGFRLIPRDGDRPSAPRPSRNGLPALEDAPHDFPPPGAQSALEQVQHELPSLDGSLNMPPPIGFESPPMTPESQALLAFPSTTLVPLRRAGAPAYDDDYYLRSEETPEYPEDDLPPPIYGYDDEEVESVYSEPSLPTRRITGEDHHGEYHIRAMYMNPILNRRRNRYPESSSWSTRPWTSEDEGEEPSHARKATNRPDGQFPPPPRMTRPLLAQLRASFGPNLVLDSPSEDSALPSPKVAVVNRRTLPPPQQPEGPPKKRDAMARHTMPKVASKVRTTMAIKRKAAALQHMLKVPDALLKTPSPGVPALSKTNAARAPPSRMTATPASPRSHARAPEQPPQRHTVPASHQGDGARHITVTAERVDPAQPVPSVVMHWYEGEREVPSDVNQEFSSCSWSPQGQNGGQDRFADDEQTIELPAPLPKKATQISVVRKSLPTAKARPTMAKAPAKMGDTKEPPKASARPANGGAFLSIPYYDDGEHAQEPEYGEQEVEQQPEQGDSGEYGEEYEAEYEGQTTADQGNVPKGYRGYDLPTYSQLSNARYPGNFNP